MQNSGKMESVKNLKSCIQVYIQQLKNNQKYFFKKTFFEELWALHFLGVCLTPGDVTIATSPML